MIASRTNNGRIAKKYTKEMEAWLIDNFFKYQNNTELSKGFSEVFNVKATRDSIANYCSRVLGIKRGHKGMGRKYSNEEEQWIKDNFEKYDTLNDLRIAFNKKFNRQIKQRAMISKQNTMGLKYSEEHKAKVFKDFRYKVRKYLDSLNDKIPFGTEMILKGYVFIKMPNHQYIPKQRYIWEQKYGKVPKDCYIGFLDKNTRNFEMDNLVLIKKRERLKYNSMSVESEQEYNKQLLEFLELETEIKKIINKQKR